MFAVPAAVLLAVLLSSLREVHRVCRPVASGLGGTVVDRFVLV